MKNKKCPYCSKTLLGSKCVDNDGQKASPGVVAVCGYCANVFKYNDNMVPMQVDESQLKLLEPETLFNLFLTTCELEKAIQKRKLRNGTVVIVNPPLTDQNPKVQV